VRAFAGARKCLAKHRLIPAAMRGFFFAVLAGIQASSATVARYRACGIMLAGLVRQWPRGR
jgi:hypothetical protein